MVIIFQKFFCISVWKWRGQQDVYPLHKRQKFNVHNTFRRRAGSLMEVLCTLRPVPTRKTPVQSSNKDNRTVLFYVAAIKISRYFHLRLTTWNLLFDIYKVQLQLSDRSLSHWSIQILLFFFQTSAFCQVRIFLYHFFDLIRSIDSNHFLFYMVCLQIKSKRERLKFSTIIADSK